MKSNIVLGVLGIGVVLVVLSGMWSTLFPATRNWTPAKEERWQAVKARIQLLIENEQLKADFDSATNGPKRVAAMLRWSGISLACVGIVGWYAVRQSS
jgi:hypothetical protein